MINPFETEDRAAFRKTMADFIATEVIPYVDEWDEAGEVPVAFVQRVEQALGNQAAEPRPLLIVIEEAHKFLDPQIARQTTSRLLKHAERLFRDQQPA